MLVLAGHLRKADYGRCPYWYQYPQKRVASWQVRLKKIRVRLATGEERDRWDKVVSEFYYLDNVDIPGRQLRYVAETFGGRCVALLSFGFPALQLSGRDQWIGWHPEQRLQRLPFVIQNSRFLVLPWIRTPNLASRVMALCLDRVEAGNLHKAVSLVT